jgi:hypothetical protein
MLRSILTLLSTLILIGGMAFGASAWAQECEMPPPPPPPAAPNA